MTGLEFLFWFSAFMVFYAYFGYALVLFVAVKLTGRQARVYDDSANNKSVSIIITCRNEEKSIAEKLENTLSLKYAQGLAGTENCEVIVASDASDDRTDEIVTSYAARGVKLVRVEERKGKEHAQSVAVQSAKGEIIFFTDAKTKLEPEALVNTLKYFSHKKVGAVSSIDKVVGSQGGEGAYVRYEMWLRRLESIFHSVVGLSGSGFAVRKEVCAPFRTDIPSDFCLLLNARRQGFCGVLGEDVVCSYGAVSSNRDEFKRKVRTVLRGITAFFKSTEVLEIGRYKEFSFQVVSHKLCRWLVPWFAILLVIASIGLVKYAEFYAATSLLIVVFSAVGVAGMRKEELNKILAVRIVTFLILSNAAIFVAWIKYLTGERSVTWSPTSHK